MNKYAIVGKGFIFPRHEKSIKETGGEVVLTCDIDETKNPDHTDWEYMFNTEKFKNEIDTVVICTPNYLHSEIAVEAMKRGKKVLCEKPLCINPYDFKFLEGVNTVLQLRHSPEVQKAKEYNPSQVSILLKMKRGIDYWTGWKGDKSKSGGLLYNLGVHYVDLLIYLLGKPLEIISIDGDNQREFSFFARFENGSGHLSIKTGVDLIPYRNLHIQKDGDLGMDINLSDKENLSYEDLHTEVYKKLINGEGTGLSEARKALEFIHELIMKNGN